MTTWAVGDIQGCSDAFERLLDALGFDQTADTLWLTGDLINRGPDSLAVMRRVMRLGERVRCVLGNHDLHFLAVAHGVNPPRSKDTLAAMLNAPDRDAMVSFLLSQPLAVFDGDRVMCHAGISPDWDLETAVRMAAEVSGALRADPPRFLGRMYGNQPARWADARTDQDRLRYAVNAFTRMRFVSSHGHLDFDCKSAPGTQPSDHYPWFAHPRRRPIDADLFFGHWSALGRVAWPEHRAWGLDTSCVWGGELTAVDTVSKQRVSVPARV